MLISRLYGSVTSTALAAQSVTATGGITSRPVADHFAESLSARDFGAAGNGSTADGAAFLAAWNAACTGAWSSAITTRTQAQGGGFVLHVPPGDYVLDVASLNFTGSITSVEIRGAGRHATRIQIPAGEYLINSSVAVRSITITDMTVVGGKGLMRYGATAQSVSSKNVFERLNLIEYTECAIGSNSDNQAYLAIHDCMFFGKASTATIGVQLPRQVGTLDMTGNSFCRNKYHIKKILDDSYSAIGPNNEFLSYETGHTVADIWLVPYLTTPNNAGSACSIVGNRFSNEGLDTTCFRILIADEDTGTGTDFLSRNVHKTSDASSAKWCHGVRVRDNGFASVGTPAAGGGQSLIYSETPNVGMLEFHGNMITGGYVPYVMQFAAGVTPVAEYLKANNLIEIPQSRFSMNRPGACNIPGWAQTTTKAGGYFSRSQILPAASDAISSYTELLTNPGVNFSTWATSAGTSDTAYAANVFGAVNTQRLQSFTASTDAVEDTVLFGSLRGGEVAWVEIVAQQAASLALTEIMLLLYEDGIITVQERIAIPTTRRRIRVPIYPTGATTSAKLRLIPSSYWTASKTDVLIEEVRFYHAPHPVNFEHAGTRGGASYNTAHVILGANHLWLDAGGTLRIKSSAPTTDNDGSPLHLNIVSNSAALNAVGNAINTTGKYIGKTVYNSTLTKNVVAVGSAASSVWNDGAGVAANTPV